jgi:hypothetical protein
MTLNLGHSWLAGFLVISTFTIPVRAQSLQAQFERMAKDHSHFPLEAVVQHRIVTIWDSEPDGDPAYRALADEQVKLINELQAASFDLPALEPLLKSPDPRIRTLAIGAIFQREEGRDLPLIATLIGDPAQTFPDFHRSMSSMGGPRPLAEMVNPQTVGDVVQAMLHYWNVPHDGGPSGEGFPPISEQDFKQYWKIYEGRAYSASWFAVSMKRATRQATPQQPQYVTDTERVLGELRALAQPDRSLIELYVLTDSKVASDAYLISEARQLGPETLVSFLQRKPVSSDPALHFYDHSNSPANDWRNQPFNRMADFILRNADQLLRPEDAPALLACESAERKPSGVSPAWSIGAALLQPERAGEILHAELEHSTRYQQTGRLTGTLWRLRGAAELPFLVDWFYSPQSGNSVEPTEFLREVQAADRADTQQLLAALVRDSRFVQTNRTELILLVDMVNSHRTDPVVDQMGSGAAWPSRYQDNRVTREDWRNSLRREYGLATRVDMKVTPQEQVLRDLPTHVPELKLSVVAVEGNPMQATYNASERDLGRVYVKINSYPSLERAQRGLERIAGMEPGVPMNLPVAEATKAYKWESHGRIIAQAGSFVIEVEGNGKQKFPLAEKTCEALIQQLVASTTLATFSGR